MIPKEPSLVTDVKRTFQIITHKLIEMNNPLLMCRLILLLGYFIDILYLESDETFIEVL